jgi:hypothetical protein
MRSSRSTRGEDAYIGVLDRNLSPDEEEELARAMAHATADIG